MSYVMRCWGCANGTRCGSEGQFLEWYDPERPADQEMGGWTWSLDRAKKFPTLGDAHEEWRRIRQYDGGFRSDGQPDRPLTAFNVEILHYLQAAQAVGHA